MHACGHDAHVAMLVGAAHLLRRRRSALRGEVVFMSSPERRLRRRRRSCSTRACPRSTAPSRSCGASASDRDGRNEARRADAAFDDSRSRSSARGPRFDAAGLRRPRAIACQIVLASRASLSREIPRRMRACSSVTQVHGGTANNVIADRVLLKGTMRALSGGRGDAVGGAPAVAQGVRQAHRAEATVRILRATRSRRTTPASRPFARAWRASCWAGLDPRDAVRGHGRRGFRVRPRGGPGRCWLLGRAAAGRVRGRAVSFDAHAARRGGDAPRRRPPRGDRDALSRRSGLLDCAPFFGRGGRGGRARSDGSAWIGGIRRGAARLDFERVIGLGRGQFRGHLEQAGEAGISRI